ncbi:MAG: WG repeat-containing protein [Bacteroidota bacterium]
MKKLYSLIIILLASYIIHAQNLVLFSDSLGASEHKGHYGFKDTAGNIVIKPKYLIGENMSAETILVNLGGQRKTDMKKVGNYYTYIDGGKWGVISKNTGQEIIPIKYEKINKSTGNIMAVCLNNKWGFIDIKGKEVVPIIYDSVKAFHKGFARVNLKGRWGFVDTKGKIIVPLKFEKANDFVWRSNHVTEALVWINEKCGSIDTMGNEIIPIKYDYIFDPQYLYYHYGLRLVKLNNKYGYIDHEYKEFILPKYDLLCCDYNLIGERYISAMLKDKYGLIDVSTGHEIIPLKYDQEIMFTEHNNAQVSINSKWGLIDTAGKEIVPLKYDQLYISIFQDGFILVALADSTQTNKYDSNGHVNYKWGLLDTLGKEITPIKYNEFESTYRLDNLIKFAVIDNNLNKTGNDEDCFLKWGYVNKIGKEVVPLKYVKIANFSEGMAAAAKCDAEFNIKWGFVDENGMERIPFKYINFQPFSEGFAAVRDSTNSWYFIDNTGKKINQLKYTYVENFASGLALVCSGNKCGFIDTKGKEITSLKYDNNKTYIDVFAISEHPNEVTYKYKEQFYDRYNKGDYLYVNQYYNHFDQLNDLPDKTYKFSNDVAIVKLKDKYGWIDKTGKEITPIIYDEIYDFSEGLAGVRLNDKWGFIDKTGKEVISIKYDAIHSSFSKGRAEAALNGKDGYIDKSGNFTP